MDETTLSYLNAQFSKVCPFPPDSPHTGQLRIQFFSEGRKTNVLNITPSQFRHIERYLCGLPLELCD